ncbi:MAG: MgtC/SapB family protein [Lachnospiraceae bacterium]
MWDWQTISETLAGVNLLSTFVRLALALLCGGVLGIERGRKNRPAGFRTYMLVCVGATLVMTTNQYMTAVYQTGDPARLGAQVISGIGFLGAGTIIVTGRNRVKGLTTAAGLWADACVGLAIGVGFYSGAILGCVMIFVVMAVLHSLDDRVTATTKQLNLYMEFKKMSDLGAFMEYVKGHGMKISEIEMTKSTNVEDIGVAVLLTLRLDKKRPHTEIIHLLYDAGGVLYVEEI